MEMSLYSDMSDSFSKPNWELFVDQKISRRLNSGKAERERNLPKNPFRVGKSLRLLCLHFYLPKVR
jgi:hypothetical protein